MGKIQKATRLPPDDAERLEEYADERGISEADALRRIIHDQLDAVEEEQNADDLLARARIGEWFTLGMLVPFLAAALLWFTVAPLPTFQLVGALSLVLSWGALTYTFATLAQVAVRDVKTAGTRIKRTLRLAIIAFRGQSYETGPLADTNRRE
jgi:predicted DNA-binding protein